MNALDEFLGQYKAQQGEITTNASLPPKPGKWSIPCEDNIYEEFLQLYARAIDEGAHLHLTELHRISGPIVVDLDFKYDDVHGTTRKYNLDTIKAFIQFYTDQIKIYFDVPESSIVAYVMEKDAPTRDGNLVKDGFHIVYPYIVSKTDVQYIIRENVIQNIVNNDIFSNIPYKNTMEDIIDEAVIKRSGWMLYGSHKQNQSPYELTYIYDHTLEALPLPANKSEIVSLLSIRNKTVNTNLKFEIARPVSTPMLPQVVINSEFDINDDITYAKELTELLSTQRAGNYTTWIDTGVCLYNISKTLCDTWITFSKKSKKFKTGECERKWESFDDYNGIKLTVRSLNLWARLDDMEGYEKVNKKYVTNFLRSNLDCEHNDVATLMHIKYQYQFVCSDLKFNNWYEFKSNRWIEMPKAKELRDKISTEIYQDYANMSAVYKKMHMEDPENKDLDDKIKICKTLLNKVKNRPFKKMVMEECEDLFNNRDFEIVLDSNKYLICFTNGVYDLKKLEFRNGCPDDYISFCTKNDYTPWSTLQNTQHARELKDFLSKILPQPDVRKYVLKLISSFLSGNTGEQKFHIWTGDGSNGKSKLVDLIEDALGDYTSKLPITVLTRKRGTGASPEVAETKGKRFVSFQEPEREDKIQVGYMKELTGGDKINTRKLYKSPIEFRPQFKTLLCCNDLPEIPSNDGGTWRRIRVVDFPSKFVDEPTGPNEYKKDTEIPEKLKTWAPYFVSLLIEMYAKFTKEGLKEPESVIKYTKEYQRRSDVYLDYIEENIVETTDESDIISFSSLFNHFKQWHIEYYNEKPNKVMFKTYMERKYGKCIKRPERWKKIKFQEFEEEVSDTDDDL
tara:strand:+ start:14533 stop:17073 length:2541 start_codon:yes stop_codon:yes gene_type:complete